MWIEIKKVKALKDGEEQTINWFEEGGGLIKRQGDTYTLCEIPLYGGESRFVRNFTRAGIEDAVKLVYHWT